MFAYCSAFILNKIESDKRKKPIKYLYVFNFYSLCKVPAYLKLSPLLRHVKHFPEFLFFRRCSGSDP